MNDFEAMSKMAKEGKDIMCATTMVEAKKAKGGGHVTMGVPEHILIDIVLNPKKYLVVMYVVNREQFNEIKKQPNEQI